jgi:putative phage-type endonuclease
MRVLCDSQRDELWYACRRGKITASAIAHVLAKAGTDSRESYKLLLTQDIEGVPDFEDDDPKPWFIEGRIYEDWARGWYSWNYNVDVIQTGFVLNDDCDWIGCSPDGLVEPDGMIEIKYRKNLKTYDKHTDKVDRATRNQIQLQLFVTGRKWCDYVNYWRDDDGNEKGHVTRVAREGEYIEKLVGACGLFWGEVWKLHESRHIR